MNGTVFVVLENGIPTRVYQYKPSLDRTLPKSTEDNKVEVYEVKDLDYLPPYEGYEEMGSG